MTLRTFPAITLWQPWASLIFAGLKAHETRGFALPDRLIGQWVAIHSAARSIRRYELDPALDQLCVNQWGRDYEVSLPHRRVLGLVRFLSSVPTERGLPIDYRDALAGDWSPGRHAWAIDPRMIDLDDQPIAKGRQLWWKIDLALSPDLAEEQRPAHGSLV
jgi:hypothetical protein